MKKQKQTKPISDEPIDTLLTRGQTAEDINGLLKQFTKALLERAMQGELTDHLGYNKHDPSGNNTGTAGTA
jgi:putative transposase